MRVSLELAGVLLIAVVAAGAAGEPVTLLKRANVDTARANLQRHEWARNVLEGYRRQVAWVMSTDRAALEALLPETTPWPVYGQSCPVCVGKQSSMGETGLWSWSLSKPDQVQCRYCKTVFPNPDYPETGRMEARRMGQVFTYYLTEAERAHPDDLTGKHAFRWASWPVHTSWTGLLRTFKASAAQRPVLPLAKLYVLTGEVAYAERCGWLLEAFARVYPKWLYHSYNGVYADLPPGEAAAEMGLHPPAGKFPKGTIVTAFPRLADPDGDGFEQLNNGFWGAGRFEAGIGGEGSVLLDFTVAYDLIRDAVGADGRPVLGDEARRRIEQDLILAGCADLEHYPRIDNKCGPARALSAAVAVLFGQPERARRALDGFERLLGEDFHFDGMCRESPSYSSMHLGLMQEIPEILAGYSDPPGYRPAQGERFDSFDPFAAVPRYRLGLESMVRMLRPDLKYPVIGDTHSGSGLDARWAEALVAHYGEAYAGLLETAQAAPLADKGSEYALWHRPPELAAGGPRELPLRTEYFPGWQVGVLRLGGPESRTAFYLNGYAYHGHRHDDTLGILYHDFGRELASDRGYIWDDPRNAWTRSTLAHNLVTVDDGNQATRERRSVLELFGRGPGIEVIEATANAYPQCSHYRRTCALVARPGGTYVLDLFRVTGGKKHSYGLNCNGALTELVGLAPTPIAEPHKWLKNLRAGTAAPPWRARWRDEDTNFELCLLSPTDRVVVADAPGWRTYKGTQLNAPPIQQVFAERRGDNLDSTYVAVMVPYQGERSPLLGAALVDCRPGAVAVRVELEGRTDYFVSTLDGGPVDNGPVRCAGGFGFVSVAGDAVRAAYLLGGTALTCGQVELKLPEPRTNRAVAAVKDTVLTLAEPFPAGAAKPGDMLLTGGTGHEIEAVDGVTVRVRAYPVPACERVELLRQASFSGSDRR